MLFETSTQSDFDWKYFFNLGISINSGWDNIGDSDIINIKDEVYISLKEYFPLPKLRKEFQNLESDFNTSFQTTMFDFLNEQNDLYDFYCEMNEDVLIRNNTIPLSDRLEKIDSLIRDFNQSDIITLSKFKWYAVDILDDK